MISDTLVIRPVDRLSFLVEKLCTQTRRPADLSPSFPHQTGCFGPPDGRLKRFSPAPPTQIRLRKSPLEASSRKPTRVRPLRTRRRRSAQRPRKPFRLRRERAARRGKRSNEAKRSAEVKPDGCLSQHRMNGSFPHVWMKRVHTCGKLHRTVHKLWKRLPRFPDGHLLPDRRVRLWRVAFRARSPAASRHRLPPPCPPPRVIGCLPFAHRLASSAASHLPAASRHQPPPPLCLPPPVTSRLPACSCGFRRSLRPSRSRLARRRP